MTSYLVTRHVIVSEVVLIEDEHEDEVRARAMYAPEGEIQHSERVEVDEIISVEQ